MLEACAELLTLSTTIPVVPLPSPIDAPTALELFTGNKTLGNKSAKIGEVILNKVRRRIKEPAYEDLIGTPIQKFGYG